MTLGQTITRLRTVKGLSQGALAEELGVSVPYAYKIVKELNEELKKMGYKVISGKVSRKYFHERFYGKDDD